MVWFLEWVPIWGVCPQQTGWAQPPCSRDQGAKLAQSWLSPSVHTTTEVTFTASVPEISYGLKLFTLSEILWGRGKMCHLHLGSEEGRGKHRTAKWKQKKSLHSSEASKPGNFHMIFWLGHWCWLVNQNLTSQRKVWFGSLESDENLSYTQD